MGGQRAGSGRRIGRVHAARHRRVGSLLAVGLALCATACSHPTHTSVASSSSSAVTSATASPAAVSCRKAGVLLPDTTNPRWEQQDRPQLAKRIPEAVPGIQVGFDNAGGNSGTQQSQATTDLAAGDCVLVVASVDPVAAAQIVSAAAAKKVPVIAYVNAIDSAGVGYFVGFDPAKIGQLQSQYIADHYKNYAAGNNRNVAVINGSKTNPLAIAQYQGHTGVLQPLLDSGSLKKVYDQFTPGGDPATAATEMEGVLVANQNNVQVAEVADDAMATSVIGVLVHQRLVGHVLVTGSGASIPALRNILLGNQAMTVETNPATSAEDAAKLISAVVQSASTTAIANGHLRTSDGGSIPAVLENPIAVDASNIGSTVIADGSATAAEICTGVPPGTAGVC